MATSSKIVIENVKPTTVSMVDDGIALVIQWHQAPGSSTKLIFVLRPPGSIILGVRAENDNVPFVDQSGISNVTWGISPGTYQVYALDASFPQSLCCSQAGPLDIGSYDTLVTVNDQGQSQVSPTR
ncbi:hypothetical protein VNI00_006725 [Paramarasmius palmivorus]|uniref:Uncharacterized protein n=1 Tax=Paramarasmius palmivorus TaxID=297713 RepID=A0AAW0D6L1_9AGAR